MLILVGQIPQPESLPSLSGDVLPALLIVGAIALLVVAYLAFDWLNSRREARKLARKRQNAREAWQRELSKTDD
jgi:hypothetical protein